MSWTIRGGLFSFTWMLLAVSPVRAETASQLFARAAGALASKDYPAAEKGFLTVLKIEPGNFGALGNLAVIYSRTDRADQAIFTYKRALKLAPANKNLALDLGLAYLRHEDYSEALPVFSRLAAADPRNLQFAELLATCELYTGRVSSAVAALESLRERDWANTGLVYLLGVGYLKQKARDKARVAFNEFLASMPPASANFVLCKAYYESGWLDDAEQQCRKTIEANANFPGAQRELGKVQVSLRSPDAETSLSVAIQQDPHDAEALYFLGALLVEQDWEDRAEPYLERAKELNPGFWGNYFYLGKANMKRKKPAQAAALFEKAAQLNAAETAVFYQLSRAYSAIGRGDDARRAMQQFRDLRRQEATETPRSSQTPLVTTER